MAWAIGFGFQEVQAKPKPYPGQHFNPPPQSTRGWGPGSELVWWEGVIVLTLGPTSHPILLSPPHPLPTVSLSSYAPPRDPFVGQVVRNGVHIWWWKVMQRQSHHLVV